MDKPKIYFTVVCGGVDSNDTRDVGEVEGMFSEAGELLGTWCNNDASWRNEYFDGFIEALGFEVVCLDDDDPRDREFREKLVAHWSDDEIEEDDE